MFVLFAEMRTGSNLLEHNLNALPDLFCHGEAFNPNFIGHPKRAELLDVSLEQRNSQPDALLKKLQDAPGLNGFRYFHDHDPRVMMSVLGNPRCAKIILTRNHVDSYVSWKIARQTGQWQLTQIDRRKSAKVRFDRAEFQTFSDQRQAFHAELVKALQSRGQTAFSIDYSDLQSVEIINGLARFLGVEPILRSVKAKVKRQNPAPMSEKVQNLDEMQSILREINSSDAHHHVAQEPERGPGVPNYIAGHTVPLLYMPISGPDQDRVVNWLAALDQVSSDELPTGFTQKTLRQWKRQRPGHRSITVVCHPVSRSYWAYCRLISEGEETQPMRRALEKKLGKALPRLDSTDGDQQGNRNGYLAFLELVRATMSGQTALHPKSDWISQVRLLQDISKFAAPDIVIRADHLESSLRWVCGEIGVQAETMPGPNNCADSGLSRIYNRSVEKATKAAYQKDYMMFGFGPWTDHAA